ncbi:MAG TPA: hypothetical protein VEW66_07890 [Thermomicrobiales bacterium]|nr:hypothetical protein [Thermomicrobiales bacterium]
MFRLLRFASVAVFALIALVSVQSASAQMMHFELDITIETEDGSPIPAGTVCVSGEVDPICQDIPADTPSGRDFLFTGLADGEHTITVNAGDYLEAVDYADAANPATEVTIVLYMEETPTELPDTGAGVTADTTGSLTGMLIVGASLFAVAAVGVRRATMLRA